MCIKPVGTIKQVDNNLFKNFLVFTFVNINNKIVDKYYESFYCKSLLMISLVS